MNVVGIDPSITATGLACTDGQSRVIGRDGITTLPIDARTAALRKLRIEITVWAVNRSPDLAVIEHPAFSRANGGAVERHYLFLAIAESLLARGVPVAEVGPGQRAQYATGKAGASKSAVVDAVARRFPQYETGGDNNLADAVVLAAMGADHLGVPLVIMPETHRAALTRVVWPNPEGTK